MIFCRITPFGWLTWNDTVSFSRVTPRGWFQQTSATVINRPNRSLLMLC